MFVYYRFSGKKTFAASNIYKQDRVKSEWKIQFCCQRQKRTQHQRKSSGESPPSLSHPIKVK